MEYSCCFLCSKYFKRKDGIGNEIVWLKCLYRHLDISLKLLNGGNDSNNERVASIKFCKKCGEIVEKFSNLYQLLEVVQMELNYQLKIILNRVKFDINMGAQVEANIADSQLLNMQRKLILDKCAAKTLKAKPLVKLSRLNSVKLRIINVKKELDENNLTTNETDMDADCDFDVKADTDCEENDEMSNWSERDSAGEIADDCLPHDLMDFDEESQTEVKSTQKKKNYAKSTCHICKKEMLKTSLYEHIKNIHNSKPNHICHICGKSFTTISNCKVHTKVCKPNPEKLEFNHVCEICNKRFEVIGSLKQHIKYVHDGVRPFKCDLCDRSFKTSRHLQEHKDRHEGKRFPCNAEGCERTFAREYYVKEHMQKEHGIKRSSQSRAIQQCKICNESFPTHIKLAIHKKNIHKNMYVCKECGKKFHSPVVLNRHMETHSEFRSFACPTIGCQQSFNIYQHFYRHKKKCKNPTAPPQNLIDNENEK